MRKMFGLLVPTVVILAASLTRGADNDPFRVLPADRLPKDSRFGKAKDYNGYFPWTPPASKEAWEARRQVVREQVLVANGLWPMPEKTPLKPVIHGKIDRDGYTVEKVFFASYPGHYVCGNLYRPKGKDGKLAGVLCPHGHWANGRFHENNEKAAENEIKIGAEKTKEGARYPLQARCAQLARMGCVVFHYDMVGYADSKQITHREGFKDAEAELRLQSFMGLQTFNSIRALDFLLGLPEVDPKRIGVTGASGGGTQTFILCAIDDRPAVAFPAVMVSTAMQGGCICENCSYLRVDTGNIELAGLFAPKPLGMVGANDWTIEIETKGLPELRFLYRLYGAEERVLAKCYKQFNHNYNQVSRELMYNWFNKHLNLGQEAPVAEKPFVPIPPKELSVFDDEHLLPKDAVDAAGLRKYLSEISDRYLESLTPKDAESLKEFRRVVGGALRAMVADELPRSDEVEAKDVSEKEEEKDGVYFRRYLLGRKGAGEQIPAVGVRGKDFDGTVVVWIHPAGKASLWQDGKLSPAAQQILDKKAAILAPDVFGTGELAAKYVQVKLDPAELKKRKVAAKDVQTVLTIWSPPGSTEGNESQAVLPSASVDKMVADLKRLKVRNAEAEMVPLSDVATIQVRDVPPLNEQYAGYTFGYNRPLLANRIHDILTAIAFARGHKLTKTVHLVGWEKAGPWALLARPLCGDSVARTAIDLNEFSFGKVRQLGDEMFLPGALKYGGMSGLAAACAPAELFIHNHHSTGSGHFLKPAYQASGQPEKREHLSAKATPEKVIAWLLR